MAEFIKPPKIDAPTPQAQIKQLEEYAYKLSNQLNYMFSVLEKNQEMK